MPWPAYRRAIERVLRSSTSYLLESQSRDGFWREYHHLPPGASEAWTTALVGWSLADRWAERDVSRARERAAFAVWEARTPAGWGYNRATACDADSTAWAVRFLATTTLQVSGPAIVSVLSRFLDSAGHAHTFVESGHDGEWGAAHDDVTACVGLALLAARAPAEVWMRPMRALGLRARAGGLHTYWWRTHAYAPILTTMLMRSAAVSRRVPQHDDLAFVPEDTGTSFEAAHRLIGATLLDDVATMDALTDELLERASGGIWAGSAELLVPAKDRRAESPAPGAHEDARGIVTTALAGRALAGVLDRA